MQLFNFRFKAMGCPCEFNFFANSASAAESHREVLHAEVLRLEHKYSRYRDDSVLSQINAAAGSGRPVAIDNETAALLSYAEQLYQQSNGLFDPTSGVLRRCWDFKSQKLPSKKQLKQILPFVSWPSVQFDAESVYLPRRGMQLDFGGWVKEFACDVVANIALQRGIQHGYINLGGDIRVLGPMLDGGGWRIGVQHPRIADAAIAFVELQFGAIATSGDYERFMMVSGKRYCHLLNPKTGMSIQPAFASVSILADSCLIAGSFSTLAMLNSEKNSAWLHDAGLPWLAVDQQLCVSGSIQFQGGS
ncbi:FAD:protein FMN transferase [Agaribacterium haliotis]|uniref:FAD:protein FMN transferase n=1 Tax=Agaribacterium haliotis TaxID=2013869 RepID=UPI000BB57116|nr:FAD:protein FMN transferase [Agaribacterium haliotis]